MAQEADAHDDADFPPPVIHEFAPVARELYASQSRPALLKGEKGTILRKEIEHELKRSDARVLSMDVFDTFLLRNNKPETARYLELSAHIAERLPASVSRRPNGIDLLIARLRGMEFSYRTRKAVDGCREGHIEQVIRFACMALNLSRDCEAMFLDTELDYEAANLTVNPVLAAVATTFRARGGKVILVSDMYLGKKEIATILTRLSNGVTAWHDKIYSSADHIVSKRSGEIFGVIQKDLDLAAEDFLHIGDAWEGDVVRPREAGWSAMHFPIARNETTERERALSRVVEELKARGHDFTASARL